MNMAQFSAECARLAVFSPEAEVLVDGLPVEIDVLPSYHDGCSKRYDKDSNTLVFLRSGSKVVLRGLSLSDLSERHPGLKLDTSALPEWQAERWRKELAECQQSEPEPKQNKNMPIYRAIDESLPLPCPCCGSDASDTGKVSYSSPTASMATWLDGSPIMEAYFCNCMSCGLSNKGIAGGYRTKKEAVAAWNRRVINRVVQIARKIIAHGDLQWSEPKEDRKIRESELREALDSLSHG